MPNDLGFPEGGITIVPPVDGRENREFEARIAQKLALVDHSQIKGELQDVTAELAEVRRELRIKSRVLRRTRVGRTCDLIWRCWSTFWGLAAIAVPIAFGIVVSATGNGAVVTPMTEAPDLITPKVKEGAFLKFRQGIFRHTVCPFDVVFVLIPVDRNGNVSGNPTTLLRPGVSPAVGAHPSVLWTQQLPAALIDGPYHVEFSFASHCPTFTRSDLLAKFEIEVLP